MNRNSSTSPVAGDAASSIEKIKGSVDRIFEILGFFTINSPVVHMDDVRERLGTAKSTTFRYFKTLSDAGLLSPLGNGAYSIGPRVVELERLVQLTDPLLHAGRVVMHEAAGSVRNSILLLSALYRDKALCIYRAGPDKIRSDGLEIDLIRSRGVPLPLFQGVGSLAILAFLPLARIKSIYLNYSKSVSNCGLGETWPQFRTHMARYRKDGYAVTVGVYNPHMAGVAVPVKDALAQKVIGSLTRVFARDDFLAADVHGLVADLSRAARAISEQLSAEQTQAPKGCDRGLIV